MLDQGEDQYLMPLFHPNQVLHSEFLELDCFQTVPLQHLQLPYHQQQCQLVQTGGAVVMHPQGPHLRYLIPLIVKGKKGKSVFTVSKSGPNIFPDFF
mgnify:CR=1 FL=1